MLRTLLIASALLGTSGNAMAHGSHDYGHDHGHGRVAQVEPYFSISFGSYRHDGFRMLYESGGDHYWSTHTTYRPLHAIVLPPRHQVHHIHHYHDHGWDKRHKWKGYRDGRDDDRRSSHRGHRDNRRHDHD